MNVASLSANKQSLKIADWLKTASWQLQKAGISTPRLDALILLEDLMQRDRSYILAHLEADLSASQHKKLNEQLNRRLKHEPLAYIRGKAEFYGRKFLVNRGVLVPRPETEVMIELLIKQRAKIRGQGLKTIIDIGTGCGNLAITAKLQFPTNEVLATEIKPRALKLAKQNAQKLDAEVKFLEGSLLEPIRYLKFDIQNSTLLANLPYVPDKHPVNQAASHEPKTAIFGGQDGLDIYRALWQQLKYYQLKPLDVLTESLPFQHPAMNQLAKASGYSVLKTEGLIQLFAPA